MGYSGYGREGQEVTINRPTSRYPAAVDLDMVGEYPVLTKSGGGYFWDEVLEYRVWVHPEAGDSDLYDGEDYVLVFATFDEALDFSRSTKGAEPPLVLVRQLEHVNEPKPGVFEHVKEERLTEWRVEWLEGSKREADTIERFLEERRGA